MKQDYQQMREKLLPNGEKQDEMWKMIIKKANENKKKRNRYRIAGLAGTVAAAVLVCALSLSQTGFADSMKGFLSKYFSKDADIQTEIKQDIQQNVYEDSDEHIKMQVQEMLTDGNFVYMDICYEALDDVGKLWLSDKKFEINGSIGLRMSEKYEQNSNGNSEGLFELEELATESERYFTYIYEDMSGSFILKDITSTFFYPMYEKQTSGKLSLSCNTDTVSYRLEGNGSPSRYYKPKYLIVSKLSYGIFGKNQGAITKTKHTETLNNWEEEVNIIFTMKDGSKIDIGNNWSAAFSLTTNVPGADFRVATGNFLEEVNHVQTLNTAINPNELAALDINGVHYKLVKNK